MRQLASMDADSLEDQYRREGHAAQGQVGVASEQALIFWLQSGASLNSLGFDLWASITVQAQRVTLLLSCSFSAVSHLRSLSYWLL